MMFGRPRIRRSLARATIVGVAISLAIVPGRAVAARADTNIDVVVFNVLAPIWAAPDWYPADMDPAFLDTEYRRERVTAFLRAQADTAEVVVLQEVQDSELPYLAAALGSRFEGVMSTNARDF